MKKKIFTTFIAATSLTILGLSLCAGSSQEHEFTHQLWINKMPTSHDEIYSLLFFIEGEKEDDPDFGIRIHEASSFRDYRDIFVWGSASDDGVSVFYLQEGEEVFYDVEIDKDCQDAPRPFSMCLSLNGDNGESLKYYSNDDLSLDVNDEYNKYNLKTFDASKVIENDI